MATPPRTNCLIVLSGSPEGVPAEPFVHLYNLLHQAAFTLQLATPGGQPCEYVNQDESSRKWLTDFKAKSYATPISLESVDVNRYAALVIPHSFGAPFDLAKDQHLAQIIQQFVKDKKAICAIGQGVAGLCCARTDETKRWCFKNYSLTGMSLYELARLPDFPTMPILIEDFIKDNGGKYAASEPDAVHVVLDRHLVTGQNERSTVAAIQNLIISQRSRGFSSR